MIGKKFIIAITLHTSYIS